VENVVLTVHLILALLLIGVVLLQRSEGGGLGMGGGGGGGGGVMSSRGAANALTKLTWVFAVAFIATSLTLTIFAAQDSASTSVVDRIDGTGTATEEAPAIPELPGGDLLPPGSADAPLVPPPAD